MCHLLPPTCATWLWQTLGLRHHLGRFIYSQSIINLKQQDLKKEPSDIFSIFILSQLVLNHLFGIKMTTTTKNNNIWIFPRMHLQLSLWNARCEGDAHLQGVEGLLVATRSLSPKWELAEASGEARWTETVCAGTAYSSIHTG